MRARSKDTKVQYNVEWMLNTLAMKETHLEKSTDVCCTYLKMCLKLYRNLKVNYKLAMIHRLYGDYIMVYSYSNMYDINMQRLV